MGKKKYLRPEDPRICRGCGEPRPLDQLETTGNARARLYRCRDCLARDAAGLKVCRRCRAVKPLAEFATDNRTLSGLAGLCWPCQRLNMARKEYLKRQKACLRRELREAPYLAAVELCRRDPGLLVSIRNSSPLAFDEALMTALDGIFERRKANARRWTKIRSTLDDFEEKWQVLYGEVEAFKRSWGVRLRRPGRAA